MILECIAFFVITSSPIQGVDIVAQSFIEFYAIMWNFKAIIDLLGFLVQKLCQKHSKHVRNSKGI